MIRTATTVSDYLKRQGLTTQAHMLLGGFPAASPEAGKTPKGDNAGIGSRISALANRLKSGKKLSGADLAFLRKHDPDLYGKAIKIARERSDYRRRLDRARTKDEADRIHIYKMQQLSMEANLKGADTEMAGMRTAALVNERADSMTNGNYRHLKREHEIQPDKNKKGKAVARYSAMVSLGQSVDAQTTGYKKKA